VDFSVENTHFVLEAEYQQKVAEGSLSDDEIWSLIRERNNIVREIQITWRAIKRQ
jgi:hypothetical protein